MTPEPTEVAFSCVPAGDEDGFLTVDEFRIGLSCAIADFQWPEGKVPDEAMLERSIASLPDGGDGSYERGLEYTWISVRNECAWYRAWLEARQNGDSAAEREALDYMTNVIPNFATVIPNFPANSIHSSVVQAQQDMAAKATLGDPSLVQDFVTYNCSGGS